jgi:predicted ester cyclase
LENRNIDVFQIVRFINANPLTLREENMKKLFIFLPVALILYFILGCQDKAIITELKAYRAQVKIEEQNKEIVKKLFEGLNNRDTDIYQELCADTYVWHFPSSNPETLSQQEELEFGKSLWAAFPDITYNIDELITADDRAIVRFNSKGTHQAEFNGIAATGNKFEATGIWIARIINGKIIEAREEYDQLGMMQQLGMELVTKKFLRPISFVRILIVLHVNFKRPKNE